PFAALPDPTNPADPLVVRHEVVHLPSASSVAALRSAWNGRPAAPGALAVFADPVFDRDDPRVSAGSPSSGKPPAAGQRVSRLRFSRQEAESILALVPPADRLGALDFAASRATALSGVLERYRIVHFATHGLLDTAHPELSGIALSMVDAAGRPQS